MRIILQIVSAVGLLLTAGPALLVFAGGLSWEAHATWMIVGMVLWFGTAPFWMQGARLPKKSSN